MTEQASEKIAALMASLDSELESYWEGALEVGLETHTKTTLGALKNILHDFAREVSALGGEGVQDRAVDLVAGTLARLHTLNSAHGEGLLETDEREMIVPFINESVEAIGVDLLRFEEEDITLAQREF